MNAGGPVSKGAGYDSNGRMPQIHRDITTLMQTGLVGWPTRDLVLFAWDAVAAILILLEGYCGYSDFRRSDSLLRGLP